MAKSFGGADVSYDADVAVLGAGVVGTATAIALCDRGYRVMTVDPNEPGSGTAVGSAGYLHDAEIFSLADRGVLKQLPHMLSDREGPLVIRASSFPSMFGWGLRYFAASRSAAVQRTIAGQASLNRLAIEATFDLAKATGADSMLVRCGGLTVFRDTETLKDAERAITVLRNEGFEVRRIGREELLALEPAVQGAVGGLHFPTAANCIDLQGFGERLGAHLRRNSGHLSSPVTRLEPQSNGSWVITAASGRLTAQRVVVSMGVNSAGLLRPLGYRVPLAPSRGYNLTLPAPDTSIVHPMIFAEPHFAATPMRGGIRLAGTVEFAAPAAKPNLRRADMLFELAKQYLPDLRRDGATRWMGVRPMTPDTVPVIAKANRHPNLFCCFGHGHLGLTQAAISARCITALIDNQVPPVNLSPFDLARFELRFSA